MNTGFRERQSIPKPRLGSNRLGWAMLAAWLLPHGWIVAEDQLKMLGNSVKDIQEASAVLYTLSQSTDLKVADVLRAMKGQDPISQNWYLSLAQSLADRSPVQAQEECQAILEQLSEDSSARYWAFCFLTSRQPELKASLLESMLSDPCPELRYEAIEQKLERLKQSPPGSKEEKRNSYSQLLEVARLPSQVMKIADLLKESDAPVNLLQHFGFLDKWYTVGPFDNKGQAGFDIASEPEKQYLRGELVPGPSLLESAGYQGKSQQVSWLESVTTEQDGSIDLAAAYQKEKGAIVYALSGFRSKEPQEAEVRIGSQNAVKVWVNGKELISREVYHAGGQIDQYSASVQLKAGLNTVFIKVCQNEQTEPWAQSWSFQLRFCDSTGLAIHQVL